MYVQDNFLQILSEITKYLVNIMISLLTPTKAFMMDDDEVFAKYKAQNEGKMDTATKNGGEACWQWLTSEEALEKEDRPKALIDMMPREIAEGLDELLMTSMGSLKDHNHLMVPQSTVWDDAYEMYLEKLEGFIKQKFTMNLCEDPDRMRVNQTIWRKIEWVTMRHRGRRERPFPLLTKNLLPRLADVLKRVENAIREVSVCLYDDQGRRAMYMRFPNCPLMRMAQCAEDNEYGMRQHGDVSAYHIIQMRGAYRLPHS